MYLNDERVPDGGVADCFANFFEEKVDKIVKTAIIDPNVYNGKTKLTASKSNFMSEIDIIDCIKQLKMKNCEGYDQIPQRYLIDGLSVLVNPLGELFSLIYSTKLIPEQWLIAKIINWYIKKHKTSLLP